MVFQDKPLVSVVRCGHCFAVLSFTAKPFMDFTPVPIDIPYDYVPPAAGPRSYSRPVVTIGKGGAQSGSYSACPLVCLRMPDGSLSWHEFRSAIPQFCE